MEKKFYEAPETEEMELELPVLLAGSDDDENPDISGTSDTPTDGTGL